MAGRKRRWKARKPDLHVRQGEPQSHGGQRRPAPAPRGPGRADLAPAQTCALCGRQARGFGYCRRLQWGRVPFLRFCSRRCLEAGSRLAERHDGMIDKTPFEKQAIRDARRPFAEALTELGLMAPFFDRPAADVDRLIEACVDGFQASLRRQAAEKSGGFPFDDEIPF